MPKTANEALRDQFIAHRIGLLRLTNTEIKRLYKVLAASDRELRATLNALRYFQAVGYSKGAPAHRKRLQGILNQMATLRREALLEMHSSLAANLEEIAAYEQEYLAKTIRRSVPKPVVAYLPEATFASPELLRAIVRSRPFKGRLLRDHFKVLARRNGRWAKKLKQSIEAGLIAGDSIPQIANSSQFASALRLHRSNVQAIVHAAVGHVSQSARQQFAKDNDDIVKGYEWVATLDTSTTLEWCIPRDGHTYDLNFEPTSGGPPWLEGPSAIHWGCRSETGYVMPSWKELGVDAKELGDTGRASMDGKVSRRKTAKDFFNESLKDIKRRQWLVETHGKRLIEAVESGEVTLEKLAELSARTKRGVTLKQLRKLDLIDAA